MRLDEVIANLRQRSGNVGKPNSPNRHSKTTSEIKMSFPLEIGIHWFFSARESSQSSAVALPDLTLPCLPI